MRIFVILAAFVLMLMVIPNVHAQNVVTYPTITIHMIDGKEFQITDSIWKQTIYPVLYSKTITSYNWSSDSNHTYIFFDYSLKGLNAFGVQFVFALEKYNNITFATVTDALLYVKNLPSLIPGYTFGQLLNMGVLPGFSSVTIKHAQQTPFYLSIPFIFLIVMIASVFILYFVFNKK